MSKPVLSLLVAAAILIASASWAQKATGSTARKSAAQARPGPSWNTVRADIEKSWAKSYFREKILSIEKKGEPEYRTEYGGRTTSTFGSASFSSVDWSVSWGETKTTKELPRGRFYRQQALVTVERPNGSRAIFTVAAIYKQEGANWDFSELATHPEVEELGGPDTPPAPPAEEALSLFLPAAQKQCLPEYKIATARLEGKPKLASYRPMVRYGYTVVLEGATAGGKKVVCTVRDTAVLTWEAPKKSWSADSRFGCSTRDCNVE